MKRDRMVRYECYICHKKIDDKDKVNIIKVKECMTFSGRQRKYKCFYCNDCFFWTKTDYL